MWNKYQHLCYINYIYQNSDNFFSQYTTYAKPLQKHEQ